MKPLQERTESGKIRNCPARSLHFHQHVGGRTWDAASNNGCFIGGEGPGFLMASLCGSSRVGTQQTLTLCSTLLRPHSWTSNELNQHACCRTTVCLTKSGVLNTTYSVTNVVSVFLRAMGGPRDAYGVFWWWTRLLNTGGCVITQSMDCTVWGNILKWWICLLLVYLISTESLSPTPSSYPFSIQRVTTKYWTTSSRKEPGSECALPLADVWLVEDKIWQISSRNNRGERGRVTRYTRVRALTRTSYSTSSSSIR